MEIRVCIFAAIFLICEFLLNEFALFVQMETETQLVADRIALNEKKVAMALGWFMFYLYADSSSLFRLLLS